MNNHRRHLAVCELLFETHPWPGIEWEEDERINEVFLYSLIREKARIELVRCMFDVDDGSRRMGL